MKRAWARDPALEVDSVGRKGKNAEGQDTFFVQAPAERTARVGSRLSGAPGGSVHCTTDWSSPTSRAISSRARSWRWRPISSPSAAAVFWWWARDRSRSAVLTGTPLEDVLPVELDERRGALRPATAGGGAAGRLPNKVIVTPEGEHHPAMRIRQFAGGDTPALVRVATAGRRRAARRSSTRRRRAGRGVVGHRRDVSRGCRAAIRAGTFDGVRRRGLVAVEDAAGLLRSQLRVLLAAGGTMDRGIVRRSGHDCGAGERRRRRRAVDRRGGS